jgi:hypothetical protein
MVGILFSFWLLSFPTLGYIDTNRLKFAHNTFHSQRKASVLAVNLLRWRGVANELIRVDGNELFNLLLDKSFRFCTYPRDYIFGASAFCAANTPQIVVDYSLDFDDASAVFARNCISEHHLYIPCFAGIGYREESSNPSSSPSWVPQLERRGQEQGRLLLPYSFQGQPLFSQQ